MKKLVAVALVLVGLLPAPAADADIIVTSAFRDVLAQEAGGAADQETSNATSGLFSETAFVTRDGGTATASQHSNIQPLALTGLGRADVQATTAGTELSAASTYVVSFSLTEPHQVTGVVALTATATPGAGSALSTFSLASVGPGTNIVFTALSSGPNSAGGPVSALLDSGNYTLGVQSNSNLLAQAIGSGTGAFDFNLAFTAQPQTAVPEPATLSLLLIGGAGVAVMKRRCRRR